jgi:hypothetical protein
LFKKITKLLTDVRHPASPWRAARRRGGAVSSPIRWEFAVSGGRELERDLTNLLFSLTCSMVYSVPAILTGVARSDCGPRHIYFQICLTAAPVSEPQANAEHVERRRLPPVER